MNANKDNALIFVSKYWKLLVSIIFSLAISILLGTKMALGFVNILIIFLVFISTFFLLAVFLRDECVFKLISRPFNRKTILLENFEKRNISLDFLKIIATFLVVVLHTVDKDCEDINYLFYCFGFCAIPLFFMVDGALLLNKENITYKYCLKKIGKILFIAFFWSFLAFLVFGILTKNFSDWYINIFGWFIQKGHNSIFWFFGTMILIYLILPFLHKLYKNTFTRRIVLLVTLLISIVIYFISLYTSMKYGYVFEGKIIQTFRVYQWLFYFYMGGVLYFNLEKIKTIVQISASLKNIIIILLFCFGAMYCYCFGKFIFAESYCEFQYSSPMIMTLIIIIFMFFISLDIHNSFIIILSNANIGVYVMHRVYLYKLFSHFNPGISTYSIMLPIMIYFCSEIIGLIIVNVKFLKNTVRI